MFQLLWVTTYGELALSRSDQFFLLLLSGIVIQCECLSQPTSVWAKQRMRLLKEYHVWYCRCSIEES